MSLKIEDIDAEFIINMRSIKILKDCFSIFPMEQFKIVKSGENENVFNFYYDGKECFVAVITNQNLSYARISCDFRNGISFYTQYHANKYKYREKSYIINQEVILRKGEVITFDIFFEMLKKADKKFVLKNIDFFI